MNHIPRITSFDEYKIAYERSLNHPDEFWSEVAEQFHWKEKWKTVQSGGFEKADFKWFEGGRLNIAENCLDRHLRELGDKTALIWEPNDPQKESKKISYRELHSEVCRLANCLKLNGIEKGDVVCIYLPMIPQLAIAMLACARIGAIHNVVFAGFSSQSLRDRINDSACKLLITADGFWRGEKLVHLKEIADEALAECPTIQKVLLIQHSMHSIHVEAGRDYFWDQWMKFSSDEHKAEVMGAEDPLFILYTSGSTGKPKGVLHTTGGYMVYVGYTFLNVFQFHEHDVYWCTADAGWITGHSYVLYGPLLNGATTIMFEGIPSWPDWNRWWNIIDKHQVNIFYTAPTAIRAFEAHSMEMFRNTSLQSLRILGTVGEPINEEAWHWYFKNVGRENCSITDTWWQTETGGICIAPLAGITPVIPSFATLPLPGIEPVVVDAEGKIITTSKAEGSLCLGRSWPGQARTIYGDHNRFQKTYFSTYAGLYFTGDGCKRNENGYYRITGRIDDVIKVSGHRLGTAEIENVINSTEHVIESAVVPVPHAIKGECLYAFVIVDAGFPAAEMEQHICHSVAHLIGPIARPEKVFVVTALPKTRSGKIMRRILRKLAAGEWDQLGDTSTLLNPESAGEIIHLMKSKMQFQE